MTPDAWDRRNPPVNEGYNNPLDRATFTLAYDSGDDEVTITASRPFFSSVSVESIVVDMDDGPTTINLGAGYTITDSTHLVIANASALGATLEQVDLYGEPAAGGVLRATILGPLALSAGPPAGASIDGSFLLTIVDPAAQFVTDGVDLLVLHLDAPYEFYANPGTDFTVVDENTLTVQLAPNAQPAPGSFNDHDAFLHGYEVYKDSDGAWPGTRVTFEDLYGSELDCTFGDDASVRQVSSPAANRLQFDGVRFLTGTRDLSKISYNGQVWTDPAGPLAGDLSVGATIISWTDTQIIVEDPAIAGMRYGIVDFIEYQGPVNAYDAQYTQSTGSTLVNVLHLHAVPVT